MSNLRISGLASGMDTDAMVQSMMKVERLKVSRYEQSRQIALWRQEAYTSMNKMFANFILNTKKNMGLTRVTSTGLSFGNSYSNLDYIRKATSSNETAATVSSTSKAVNGSYTIEVKELAKGASFTSKDIRTVGDLGNSVSFTINGKEIVVGDGSNKVTIDDVAKKINSTKIETFEGKLVTEGKINDGGSIRELTEEEMKQVKEVSLGVTAFYDKNNGRLFMQTTETGENAKIEMSGSFASMLGYVDSAEESYSDGSGAIYKAGKDAKITFNGVTLNYSSNNINLNGLNIELKAQGTTTIKVDTNVDGIMEKIQNFINDYNELVDKVSKSLNEKRYTQYKPLSQEEKKAMHEDDAKLWEEKARSGMLNSDETIQRALQSIRTDLYKTVENVTGSFNHITQIGITTEKYSRGTAGGKLQIDEEKLRAAIEKDPEGVMELLFTEPSAMEGKPVSPTEPVQGEGEPDDKFAERMTEYNEELKTYQEALRAYERENKQYRNVNSGVFTRMYDDLTDGMKSIIDKSGPGEDAELFRTVKSNILLDFVTKKSSISDLDKEVLDANRKIDDLNVMLYRKENAYYAKFANMEKMLHQMNSQSNWLTQQLMR
ncbi:flagellar filament capping protein FliD [Tissierella carlieri]|uniref:Flagellar hook-associated protein 2 n=1 Tax=Tissierella carlieri TaxID=689904 RepID=A0ABT1SH27_9FIRM|nr:flagellar filament capping protein FliD [Tissierella carlieri]MCQ4925575.1 flagellar filament capping protein FliD [Tissierella carlieri]